MLRYLLYYPLLLLTESILAQHQPDPVRYHQSPVNIEDFRCILGEHSINLHYETSSEHIFHDQSLVALDYDSGSFIEFDGEHFDLKQFHFHTPSEHWINGAAFPVEMHMVHRSMVRDQLLVIAFLFEEGAEDRFIRQFLEDVPEGRRHVDNERKFIDINQELLPENFDSYYYYEGSLTTPPYSENVKWIVDRRVHSLSTEQVDRLEYLEGDNHRGVQHIYDRVIEKVEQKKQ